MSERIAPPMNALPQQKLGKVLPFRPTHPANQKAAVSDPPFVASPDTEIVDTIFHVLQNHLQTIGLGLDLLLTESLPFIDLREYQGLPQSVERMSRSLHELREYSTPQPLSFSTENLADVVERVSQKVAQAWERPEWIMRTICHAPLATPRLDWRQISSALERTISCAYALLPTEGGEVEIESAVTSVGAQRFVEIHVRSLSPIPLTISADALFCPFAQINQHQLGLSLILAQQTTFRLHGQFLFCKPEDRQGCFTLRFPLEARRKTGFLPHKNLSSPPRHPLFPRR